MDRNVCWLQRTTQTLPVVTSRESSSVKIACNVFYIYNRMLTDPNVMASFLALNLIIIILIFAFLNWRLLQQRETEAKVLFSCKMPPVMCVL